MQIEVTCLSKTEILNGLSFLYTFSLHNKKVYVQMSLRKMVKPHTCKDLHRCIRLEVDGKLVDLPPCEGIIILNILRYVFVTLYFTNLLMKLIDLIYLWSSIYQGGSVAPSG